MVGVKKIAELQTRIEKLERLVACPQCRGLGSVQTSFGPDECPDCHGSKINPALQPL